MGHSFGKTETSTVFQIRNRLQLPNVTFCFSGKGPNSRFISETLHLEISKDSATKVEF